MLRPNRRPSHSNGDDLNGSASSLDLNYGTATLPGGGVPSYGYGAHASSATQYPAAAISSPLAASFGRKPDNSYSIYKDKAVRSRGGGALDIVLAIAKQPLAWAALVSVVLLWNILSYRSQVNGLLGDLNVESIQHAREAYNKLQTSKLHMEREHAKLKSQERQGTQKFIDLDKSFKYLIREKEELKKQLKTVAQQASAIPRAPTALAPPKEQAYKDLIKSLQASVQRESRRAVLEKFGAPPYRVEMTVKLPSNLNQPLTFVVELAPLEHMPHSVHLFLEQVAHGLWSGSGYFYVNGPHVIQCGPQATLKEGDVMARPEDERVRALAPFTELQLDGLAYPEYSDEFTHLPWTLGFTGRPGGPDWYINKRNNTEEHGPGGIGSVHELSSDYGDPCFAKVVDGFDVVKSMFAEATIQTDGDTKYYFEEPIQLVKAEIIGWNQQETAEAAAIASTVTILHATDQKVDVNAAIEVATASGTVQNLTDAASKIAASLAEVGESQKKVDGLNHGPWNVRKDSQNREKQDLGSDQGTPSQDTIDGNAGLKKDKAVETEEYAAGPSLSEGTAAIGEEPGKTQVEVPDDGLPRPGGGASTVVKDAKTSNKAAGLIYESGNIDPQYAELEETAKVTDAKSESSGGAEKKKKKELMMARS